MADKKTISEFDLSNSGNIMGHIIDSFTLTPLNIYVNDKGELAASNILNWDKTFIDLNSDSELLIFIKNNMKGNKVQLTLKLFSIYKESGEIVVEFYPNSSTHKHVGKIPFRTPSNSPQYYIQSSKAFDVDSISIRLTFKDIFWISFAEVKVDIFQPRIFSIQRYK